MSNNEDDYEDDYEDGYENEYKKFQERYKGLRKEWKDDSDDWSDEQKHRHPENMKIANDEYHLPRHKPDTQRHKAQVLRADNSNSRELGGREEAAEEWGDDSNEGHELRIHKLRDTNQLLVHTMAHVNGEYEYQTGGMHDMDEDLRRELEEENDGNIFERWEHNRAVEGGYVEEREDEEEPEDENSDMDILYDSD